MTADAGSFRLEDVLRHRLGPASTLGLEPGSVVVVDPGLTALTSLAPVLEAGRVVLVDPGEPTVDGVQRTLDDVRDASPDRVVAIGGGSVIDTGKIAAALAKSESDVGEHFLGIRSLRREVGLVAIPTTAGSGAEATRTCVLSDGGRKTWMWDDALAPDEVVIDPSLTVDLPQSPTLASGLDAFVHAVEAYTNRNRDAQADAAALWAVSTIVGALPRVAQVPDDLRARRSMMLAAAAAGVAIDRCGTAMAHCVGHALAAFTSMPHGLAVALGLRATIEWSMEARTDRFATVAGLMGDGPAMAEALDRFLDAVGFDGVSRPYRATPLDPRALAAEMMAEQNLPMAMANARPPDDSEWNELARMVTDRWIRS